MFVAPVWRAEPTGGSRPSRILPPHLPIGRGGGDTAQAVTEGEKSKNSAIFVECPFFSQCGEGVFSRRANEIVITTEPLSDKEQ